MQQVQQLVQVRSKAWYGLVVVDLSLQRFWQWPEVHIRHAGCSTASRQLLACQAISKAFAHCAVSV